MSAVRRASQRVRECVERGEQALFVSNALSLPAGSSGYPIGMSIVTTRRLILDMGRGVYLQVGGWLRGSGGGGGGGRVADSL